MERIKLDEALNQILDESVKKLEAQNAPDKILEGVEEIIRGDRARPQPSTPALFIYCDAARNAHERRAMHETWVLPLVIVAVVKDDEPEDGYKNATALAAKARSVLLEDRRLNKLNFVQDLYSDRFEASAPWLREGQVFYSLAVVNVVFTILEI